MSQPMNVNFGVYALADLDGQGNWTHAAGHTGGSIDVAATGIDASQCASLTTNSGDDTWYQRPWDASTLPDDVIEPGMWNKVTFKFQINTTLGAGSVQTSLAEGSTNTMWDFVVDNSTGACSLVDRNGVQSCGSVSLDAPHTAEITTDENMLIIVKIDTVAVFSTGLAKVASVDVFEMYFADASVTQADAFYWDDITVYARTTANVYKFFIGR